MKETVCLVSLGCPKNLIDSEVILGLFSQKGYSLTTDPSKAEILIINTCSFIQDASQEAIDTILQLGRYKKEGHCQRLIVSGCLPQRYGKILEKEFPEVDLFVGTGAFQKLPQILTQRSNKKSYLNPSTFLYNEKTPRILSTPSFTAYLKIAEGCSKFCTFCTVPKIRGPYRSRRLPSVLKEAKRLADQGVQELIFVAQDTTAYGEDLQDGTNLEKLLKALVEVHGLRWIRILYAFPKAHYFSDGLLETLALEEKICPYLDLPIQHIDDGILRRMGRKSKGQEIRNLIQRIRAFIPDISLRSSLIVGFPGEEEAQFNSLFEFIEETRFDHLGVFKYSKEEGTPAFRLPNQVPEEVKEERLGVLMERQKEISLNKHKRIVGKRTEVLVEGKNQKGTLKGRLKTQAPEIDGSVFLKGEAKPGDWVIARITQAHPYDLMGKIEKHLL
ncbi:MAG: ribosomal protein S12 methylthiotransferase RimO [Deltaproteobacteria bacterium RBG_16_48_10]|nr:MAG: ribosomal protein S12 methylthiotransferase RimO [Deltaproteobacteria bacterium RBG_16_48_10]